MTTWNCKNSSIDYMYKSLLIISSWISPSHELPSSDSFQNRKDLWSYWVCQRPYLFYMPLHILLPYKIMMLLNWYYMLSCITYYITDIRSWTWIVQMRWLIIRDSSWLRSGQKCVCQGPTACWITYMHMQTRMHTHTDSTLQISTITYMHMQTCTHTRTHTLTLRSKYQQSQIHTCRHICTHAQTLPSKYQQFHPPSQSLTCRDRTCALYTTVMRS